MQTFCILGDSIAWGAFDAECGGWADRLKNYVMKHYDGGVYNLGISGDTTKEVLKRFNAEAEVREPNTILFAIGINDARQDINVSLEMFTSNIEELVERARRQHTDVFLVGLTRVDESKIPANDKGAATNADIEKYDNVLKEVSQKHACTYIDMSNVVSADDLLDGLHPNTEGHRKMFEKIKRELNFKEEVR